MKLFIEEHKYYTEESKALLKKILNFEQGGSFSTDMVGYYYSNDIHDTVFFLPKVVMDKNDKVFGKYAPEKIIDLQEALENKTITTDEYQFIYGLSVWIYRSIAVFRNTADDKHRKILLYRDIPSDSMTGEHIYNTFLDILISILCFNEQNQNYFTFILKNIHSGFNKINWTKTISQGHALIQDGSPLYINIVNRKKQVNMEEELFIIFFSILHHMQVKYGFPVNINYNFPLITDDAFDNYLEGYGEIRLIQIRHKYFADKLVKMWQLCYDFFCKQSQIQNNTNYSDHLLAKDFNIVFETMIDHLLSEKDRRVDNMNLKDQTDGKRVDHIYAWDGLMHNENEIFYIGDSKYYKLANNPPSNSIYKQYTYARNVIQANLDLFNQKDKNGKRVKKPGDDYLIYRDEDTEGYNITPNFFIRGHVPEDGNYENDDLEVKGDMEKKVHFENRLFDRDTLLLQHYDINFLYVLSVYGSEDVLAQETFRLKARMLFRDRIIEDIKKEYSFFSLQLKPIEINENDDEEEITDRDRMNKLVEQKYFHRMLGKAFRPYKEKEFLYLSLEKKPEYFKDNMKLLSDLSADFNIREYALGTDPRDVINKFAELTFAPAEGAGNGEKQGCKVFKFIDMADEVFLIGGYRTDKDQLTWIKDHGYNIRASVYRHGYSDGLIDENVVSARYLILYEIGSAEKLDYHIYPIDEFKIRSQEWMEKHEYPEPDGRYIVYSIGEEVSFENAVVNSMIEKAKYNEIGYRKHSNQEISQEWMDGNVGAPCFLKGSEIAEYALASHRKIRKALVAVDFTDKELANIESRLCVHTFVSDDMNQYLKIFTESNYVIYSNKNAHKVFKIVGVPFISIEPQEGAMIRRFAAPIKKQYPDHKQRDKQREDFCLNFKLEPAEDVTQLSQEKINKKPEGLSVYDFHVVDIESVK